MTVTFDTTKCHRVIAIDGPAASGKSSVARVLAQRLGFVYVNTGAMYRVATLLVLRRGLNPSDSSQQEAIIDLVRSDAIEYGVAAGVSTLRLDGEDPSEELSSPEVTAAVSQVASIPGVRAILVARQQAYALDHEIVMEGRDIGTVVFPETPYKFYVDASPEVRAQRRAAQGVVEDLNRRDKIDSSRAASPLKIAEGAVIVDSSFLSIDGVVDAIIQALKESQFRF